MNAGRSDALRRALPALWGCALCVLAGCEQSVLEPPPPPSKFDLATAPPGALGAHPAARAKERVRPGAPPGAQPTPSPPSGGEGSDAGTDPKPQAPEGVSL